jgi:hypothetical protein
MKINQSRAKSLGAAFEESRADRAERRNQIDTIEFTMETNLDTILRYWGT